MAQIKCEYCGTAFDPDLGICPLCGIPEEMEQYATSHSVAPAPAPAPTSAPAPRPAPRMPVEPHQPREAERRAAAKSSKSARKRTNARGGKKEDKIPAWISVTICGVLTVAVVLGGGIALLQTDIFKVSDELEEALSLPYESVVEETETAEEEVVVNLDVECTALSLNYGEVTLFEQGEQLTLTAITEPTTAAEHVTWVSGDESIVTVSTTGVITAISGGSTTVTALCGDQMATCEVRCGFEVASTETSEETATEAPATTENVDEENFTARLNLTDFTLFEAGETAQLTVSGAPSSLTVDWSVANSGVATIDSTGMVTAVKTGTTKVTAKVGDQTLECYVRCNITGSADSSTTDGTGASTSTVAASLSHEDVTLSMGESFTISVSGSTTANTFTSSNGGVCSVSGGTVTAVGYGTSNITTEVNGETLTCIVRVP